MKIDERYKSMQTHIQNAYNSASDKGAVIPENKNLQNLANTIDSIIQGTGENDYEENLAYIKQQDLLSDINGIVKFNKNEYTEKYVNRIENLLRDMTEGE